MNLIQNTLELLIKRKDQLTKALEENELFLRPTPSYSSIPFVSITPAETSNESSNENSNEPSTPETSNPNFHYFPNVIDASNENLIVTSARYSSKLSPVNSISPPLSPKLPPRSLSNENVKNQKPVIVIENQSFGLQRSSGILVVEPKQFYTQTKKEREEKKEENISPKNITRTLSSPNSPNLSSSPSSRITSFFSFDFDKKEKEKCVHPYKVVCHAEKLSEEVKKRKEYAYEYRMKAEKLRLQFLDELKVIILFYFNFSFLIFI